MNSWTILLCTFLLFGTNCSDANTSVPDDTPLSADTASPPKSDAFSDMLVSTDHGGSQDTSVPADSVLLVDTVADTGPEDGGTDLGSPDVDTPVDTTLPDAEGLTPIGTGVFLLDVDSEALNVASASARFVDFEPLPELPEETFPCTIGMVDPDEESETQFGYDSGQVTVSGLLQKVTFETSSDPSTGTDYASGLDDKLEDLLPAGGALISVSAEGGDDIDAWSGVVQAPEPVTISKPKMGFGKSQSVSQDLNVQWNPGSGTVVIVSVSPLSPLFQSQKGNIITCWFEEGDGTGAIPSELLSQVLDGKLSQNAALGITRIKTDSADNDTHTIPLTAARASGGLLSLKP